MAKKSTHRFAAGSLERVVHINLRELHLSEREAAFTYEDFEFPAHVEVALETLLPKKVVKELRKAWGHMRAGMPYFLGQEAKANSIDGVVDRLTSVANLADALQTILLHIPRSKVGNILADQPRSLGRSELKLPDIQRALNDLLCRTYAGLAEIEKIRAQAQQRTGRPKSTPTGVVGQIAAIVAAYGRMPLSKSPDSPFMRVCELMWEALGLGPASPRHAVETFVRELQSGNTWACAYSHSGRCGWRAFVIEPNNRAGRSYQARVIKLKLNADAILDEMFGRLERPSTGKGG